jgi:hypothetical protein
MVLGTSCSHPERDMMSVRQVSWLRIDAASAFPDYSGGIMEAAPRIQWRDRSAHI